MAVETSRDLGAAPRATRPPPTGLGVVDEASARMIEVERLFESVNTCPTLAGQATLHNSLLHPLQSVAELQARHVALEELRSHVRLRERLESLLSTAASRERPLYELLFGHFMGFMGKTPNPMEIEGYGYEVYRRGTRFLLDLLASARHLPKAESPYLQGLIGALTGYAGTSAQQFMAGPVYVTERGLALKGQLRPYVPRIKFRPSLLKPRLLAATVLAAVLMHVEPVASYLQSPALPLAMVFLMPLVGLYIPMVGNFDRDNFIYPLRDRFRGAEELQRALAALGTLDMLLAFDRYARDFPTLAVLPELREDRRHGMRLRQVRNPILGKTNAEYIANDLDLDRDRTLFITGPNSGGKTALCKTLAQVQLLAQIGCYVPAREAELVLADRIFYQAPEVGTLADREGRFGTELKRTKEIFMATTPRTLVILDEMAEGTTYEEKLAISTAVLDGFARIGASTVLITHNHELVEGYNRRGLGQCRQVEFSAEMPTYRLVDGISKVSHADRVARKLGFSTEDIERYLRNQGY